MTIGRYPYPASEISLIPQKPHAEAISAVRRAIDGHLDWIAEREQDIAQIEQGIEDRNALIRRHKAAIEDVRRRVDEMVETLRALDARYAPADTESRG